MVWTIHSPSSQGCPGYTGFTIYVWQGTPSGQHLRLKFFESRDSKLGPANVCPQPLWGHDGVSHYEIKRICNARCHKGVDELWVEWQGYDQSQHGWVARSSLIQDVPHLVHAFEPNASVFKARTSAPKRASTAVRDSVFNHLHQPCQSRHFTLVKFGVL